MKRVAVLGAGLSGLSAAYFLKKGGLTPWIFEASPRAGGVIRTEQQHGFQFEYGPNSLLLNGGELADLMTELGLESEVVEANSEAKKRFIVRNGKAVAAPMSLGSFLTSPLLSCSGKLRLLSEPFRPKSQQPDESLAAFAERRLGKEALDYLLNPFVSGVYAGTPEKLSARYSFPLLWELEQSYGSLVKGFFQKVRPSKPKTKRRLISFRQGIQTLTDALAQNIGDHLHLKTPVQQIRKDPTHWFINEQPFDAVISTLPLHVLSFPNLKLNTLNLTLPYSPITVWHLGFHRNQIKHPLDGFGLLVPEVEKLNILGCLFPTTVFPGRADDGHVLLTVFMGGGRQPHLTALLPEDSLKLALTDLNQLLGLQGAPLWEKCISWSQAIPQYEEGYGAFLNELADFEQQNPGWFFSGNYRDGVSVSDCIGGSKRIAAEAGKHFGYTLN
jgi:protoporphyrinogen/coproporphyrinogen III oxidase